MRNALAALFVAALLVPGAGADLAWHAPAEGRAGHPVQAAWAAVASTEPLTLRHHATADVRILLDEEVLFESASIHEHGGVHALLFTPPRPGLLRLEATGPDGAAVHEMEVHAAHPAEDIPWAEWQVLGLDVERVGPDQRLTLTGYHSLGNLHWDHGTLWDLRDGAGGLVVSSLDAGHGLPPIVAPAAAATAARATLTSIVAGTPTFGARLLETGLAAERQDPVPRLLPLLTTCRGPLYLDAPTDATGLVIQEGATVRATALPGRALRPAVHASLVQLGQVEQTTLWSIHSQGTAPTFAFGVPRPGDYLLRVGGDADCDVRLRVVPWDDPVHPVLSQPAAPGRLEARLDVEGTSLHAHLAALGADGAPLDHYEFDVRVVHPDLRHGRLVWQGKLHGHVGEASFSLHGLRPGEHVVHVYPSPQSAGTPPLAADGPEGFHYTFMIDGADVPEPAGVDAPLAGLVALLALAVAFRRAAAARAGAGRGRRGTHR